MLSYHIISFIQSTSEVIVHASEKDISPVLGALAGAIIGALAVFLSNYIVQRREANRHDQRWLRNELKDLYGTAIKNLTLLADKRHLNGKPESVMEAFANIQRVLILLAVYNPKAQDDFLTISEELKKASKDQSGSWLRKTSISQVAQRGLDKLIAVIKDDTGFDFDIRKK